MNKKILGTLIALALTSSVVGAEEAPSYTFIDAGYLSLSDSDLDTNGFNIRGSFEINDIFFINADFASVSGDIEGFDVDVDRRDIGFGAKYDTGNGNSWFVSYTFGNFDFNDGDSDLDTVRVGLRSQINETFELNFSVTSNDSEFLGRDTGIQVGTLFSVSNDLQISFEYESIGGDIDLDILSLNVRKSF